MRLAPLHVGFLNRVYAPDYHPSAFESALQLIQTAETLGLKSAWVAQHHAGSEAGRLPSPLVLLAAAAQRTFRIQLGTGVVVLPLESATRLAEDASVLDALSAGRLQLGLGAGFDPLTFQAFGQRIEDRHAAYDHKLERLQKLFDGSPLADLPDHSFASSAPRLQSEAGKVGLQPPARDLRGRLWEAGGRVEAIAARRNGFLVAPREPNVESEQSLVRRYEASWETCGAAQPARVALVRGIFPGRSQQQVEDEIGADIRIYTQRFGEALDSLDLSTVLRRLGILWGTPQQIVHEIAAQGVLKGVSHFIAQVQTRSTPLEVAERRLRLFAEEIVPALQA